KKDHVRAIGTKERIDLKKYSPQPHQAAEPSDDDSDDDIEKDSDAEILPPVKIGNDALLGTRWSFQPQYSGWSDAHPWVRALLQESDHILLRNKDQTSFDTLRVSLRTDSRCSDHIALQGHLTFSQTALPSRKPKVDAREKTAVK
ncbi:MAG TPA: hypothetical protein VN457_02310, partial [Chlamydiales bacterium]|nr:hypothetical protein [Chlamydiales bacterium]